jgi:exodeoxyribonuclease-1
VIVYDLRHDPADWANKTVDELKAIRFAPYDQRQMEGFVPLPAKELVYNKCPAVAPLGVLDQPAQERILLDIPTVQNHLNTLLRTDLPEKLREVFGGDRGFTKSTDVDAQLYEGFVGERDKPKMAAIRAADAKLLADFVPDFADERLPALLLRYKGRNFAQSLSETERGDWEAYRAARLQADAARFSQELARLAAANPSQRDQFLLQELQLWLESILPATD